MSESAPRLEREEIEQAESEQVDEQIVQETFKEIAKLIRSLEGMPVEFGIAKKLSELLRMIEP